MRAAVLMLAAIAVAAPPALAAETSPPAHHVPHHPSHDDHHREPHHATHHAPPRRASRHVPPHAKAAAAAAAAAAATAAAAAAAAAAPAAPAAPPPRVVGSVTSLPIPRFASLRSELVNLRSGPGTRYPIQWVYKRRDLPVEIEREYDVWRLVEDRDGTRGWVHQATLIGTRTFMVLPASAPAPVPAEPKDGAALATAQTLRATPASDGAPRAYLKPGVIGRLLACTAGSDWCRVSVHGIDGYLERTAIWGILPGEVVGAS